MDLSRSSLDVEFAEGGCEILVNIQNVTDFLPLVRNRFQAFVGTDGTFRSWVNDNVMPQGAMLTTQDVSVMGLLGATTLAQCTAYALGMGSTEQQRLPDGFNPATQAAATAIINSFRAPEGWVRPRMVFFAHSYGGTICMALARYVKSISAESVVSVCTFGSPPPGDLRLFTNLRLMDIGRWQNVQDYVCAMPFFPENAPTAYRLANLATRVQWGRQFQMGDGRVLHPDGMIGVADRLRIDSVISEASMLNFMINNDALVAREHALSTYDERLLAAIARIVPATPIVNAANQANVPPRGFANEVPMNVLQAIDRAPLPAVPPEVPRSFGDFSLPFQSAKENGLPVVKYYETTVAIAASRKKARDLARALNSSWKRWNRTRVGNADNLVYAIKNAFLEE